MARRHDPIGRWFRQARVGQWLGAWAGALYIRLVYHSSRWEVAGQHNLDAVLARGCGFIGATWHGRLFLIAALARRGRNNVAMISNNRDGDLIAAAVRRFGITAVRGSSYDHAKDRDKGGRAVFSAAHAELTERKAVLCLTPDGPRGPRMRAQMGVAVLAASTGVPVLPVAFSARRGKVMRTWDRFLVPWPFTRGRIVYGPPMDPPEGRGPGVLEGWCDQIEAAMIAVTRDADTGAGRSPVEPDERRAKR